MFCTAVLSLLVALLAAAYGYQQAFLVAVICFVINAVLVIVELDQRIPPIRLALLAHRSRTRDSSISRYTP
jgi:hypothetical protein